MDTALVSSIVSAIIGQVQSAVVDRMLAADAGQGNSTAELIDAAQQKAGQSGQSGRRHRQECQSERV